MSVPRTDRTDVDAFVAFEAAGWERIGDTYHRFFGPITGRVVEPLLDAAAVGPGTRVLDVATGPGYAAARAAARGADATGVDIAPGMVALARRLWPDVAFRPADAHRLPFDAASFDAVVANFLIPHLADHEQAVDEFARVLEAGGRLALTTWDQPERSRLLGAFVDALRLAGAGPPPDLPTGPDLFRYADDDAFADLLRGGEFEGVTVRRIAFTVWLPSAAALWDGVLHGAVRIAALVRAQSPHTQGRIRRAFEQALERHRVADGTELPVSVKLAAGRRR